MWYSKICNGEHTPINIALYAFGIGICLGLGLGLASFSNDHLWFGLHWVALATFHMLEYVITALFNPKRVNLECMQIAFKLF